MTGKNREIDRAKRALIASAGALGLAGALPAARSEQIASAQSSTVSVAQKGRYEMVALRQESINVTAIQSRVRAVDVRNLKPTLKANLDHVLRVIDIAQGTPEEWGGERLWGSKQDLICLHEFPIQGFQPWNRTDLHKVAFDLPGPESEAVGAKAREHGCYIAFGCYARVEGWPRHVVNMSVIMGPDGGIVDTQWKARNILGLFGDSALIGTTVYDVLDRYVEMYGWDRVLPIARTDIGNLAMTAVGMEPLLYQCLALKGAEILIMTVTGGSNAESVQSTARYNRLYSIGVGNSVSPGNLGFLESAGGKDAGTVIAGPDGSLLAETDNHHEDTASTRIPIGDFRRTRRFPEVPMALFRSVMNQYEPRFGPNNFLGELPETYKDAGALVKSRLQRAGG